MGITTNSEGETFFYVDYAQLAHIINPPTFSMKLREPSESEKAFYTVNIEHLMAYLRGNLISLVLCPVAGNANEAIPIAINAASNPINSELPDLWVLVDCSTSMNKSFKTLKLRLIEMLSTLALSNPSTKLHLIAFSYSVTEISETLFLAIVLAGKS